MPLIELKTYRPVCDGCGIAGSTWQCRESPDDVDLPAGWEAVVLQYGEGEVVGIDYLCSECAERPDDIPENDSRA